MQSQFSTEDPDDQIKTKTKVYVSGPLTEEAIPNSSSGEADKKSKCNCLGEAVDDPP